MSTASTATGELADVLSRYEVVLGLEVHVELGTRTKMFCSCPTVFGAEPNTQICPVCLGLPGALPVVNAVGVESAIRIGLALDCSIAEWCRFARKNYFYPDMPKNFQTSQYDEPICFDGALDVDVDGKTVRIGIERAHMEEDTGKSTHVGGATGRIHGATHSLVDFNRAGIPLVEIVTKPIVGTGADAPAVARAYVAAIRDIVRALGVSDARMDQGSVRADVNVSLMPIGASEFGTRTETKNVNSLRSVERTVRYEMVRQAQILDDGGVIVQETRHFNEATGETVGGRTKETATDYRYFPEPDLVPVAPDPAWVAELRAALPELPAAKRTRLRAEWGLSELDMQAIDNAGAFELIEATVAAGAGPESARKWWLGELSRHANEAGVELSELSVTPAHVAELQSLVDGGRLNDKLARGVLAGVLAGEGTPTEVMTARGVEVVSDTGALTTAVDEAIAANPDVAEKVRSGKVAAAGVLVGAVMKTTRGQADAKTVRELILGRLGVQ
ncbi:Asp-tRNA(Asn)/Glu-tRNA(Gln) amidotransferase subunit GatB [Actinocatenispora rupis]|uniref:Aspartyl/glutamyl-tRNA(Asn/Gln) amidotransferase subunit B n=1 Tax=Actinocatenispora rupis TaxID=519421 RepID=A0A8J3NG34_9ACTN|nr:Asp-tRNA(Asn)/Glu-tRNA(Gln) amidotransferase subunit GatB [Actinocatenispora rupis]GID14429.1 aspartyl/glutamyl-tRNA(Asn/Gln) amidotransferase subunit B [Actinocatenispora rupis]